MSSCNHRRRRHVLSVRTGFTSHLAHRARPTVVGAVLLLWMTASAEGAEPTRDYQGRPFVTQAAPSLSFERRLCPRPHGIDYPFEEQTARGAALFSRFPAFTLSDRRIHISGPWYDNREANGHFEHGITSVEAMPNFRQGPADIRAIPRERKWQLMTDPLWWGHAQRLADRLAQSDPADPRIAPLRTFGVDHKFSPDRAAYLALGRYVWEHERAAQDERQLGVRYAMIDIEGTGGWEHQRDCFGWLYEGLAQAAREQNVDIVPVLYGQWTFCVGAVHESMRQGGTGDPEYLLDERDTMDGPDPTLVAADALHGVVSMDGYLQGMWGREPFYQRKADGALVLVDGRPVFNDLSKTTVYGQEVPLEKNEAERCLQDLYRQAVRMYLLHHRLAGAYPAHSGARKDFLRNVRVGGWSRITNEGVQGVELNDRPLPGWEFELLIGLYLFTADDVVVWSSDTNHPPGPLGADYTKWWKYNAHGVVEYLVKAAHRYSSLDPLHRGPFRWCWFRLPMVNRNQTDGDRYDQKPLVFGKLRTFEGREWLELFAAWPALDHQKAELLVWIDRDGLRSPAYRVGLADGRSYFLDAWQLPEGFAGLEGRDIWLRFTDQLGQVRTWRGDWRESVDPSVLPPEVYSGPERTGSP